MKNLKRIVGLISLFAAGAVGAQGSPTKVYKSEPEGCLTTDGKTTCRIVRFDRDSTLIKRAVLGVSVQTTGTKRDTIGVFIASVTPDGPAEKAGIVEGERIASINGVDLRVAAADVEDSYTAGLASHRLTREMQKLTPGGRVTLRVYSGGRYRDVQVTTARASDIMKSRSGFGMAFPNMPGMPHMQIFKREMEGMQPMMLRTAPGALMPTRIRVAPSVPKQPIHFHLDSDDDIQVDAAAPVPASPKPAKTTTKIKGSI